MTSAPLDATRSLRLPYRFGSYLLFDRIGAGGMAEIFLARGRTQVGATRLAVVKLVLPVLSGDERFASMLIAEAKLAAQLSHANVVQTYDLGREDGRIYIAMEYVEGLDLHELLRRCSKQKIALPAEFAFFVVGETLRALDYAHRRTDADGKPLGIVHRDVSPSNVLLSMEGEVKLCDFGIARAMNERSDGDEAIEGKASYMSPEHACGEPLDGRADVFAASIVLWELLAGRKLYKPSADADMLSLAREVAIPPLPDRGFPDHARLNEIVMRGLSKDRDRRYATALAMARDLDDYAGAHRLFASPLRLGNFLEEHFGFELVESRRARERAAAAMENGPLVAIEVIAPAPSRPRESAPEVRPAAPALPVEDSAVRSLPPEPSFPGVQLAVPPPTPPVAPRWTSGFVAKVVAGGVAIAGAAAAAGYLLARC